MTPLPHFPMGFVEGSLSLESFISIRYTACAGYRGDPVGFYSVLLHNLTSLKITYLEEQKNLADIEPKWREEQVSGLATRLRLIRERYST